MKTKKFLNMYILFEYTVLISYKVHVQPIWLTCGLCTWAYCSQIVEPRELKWNATVNINYLKKDGICWACNEK